MNNVIKTLASIALVAAMVAPAIAQDASVDINGDGMYSLPELQAVMPEMSEDQFATLDASGDGLLDAGEIADGVAAGMLPG